MSAYFLKHHRFDIKTVGLSAVKGVSNQSQAKLYFDINTPQNASVQVIFPTNSLKFNNPALRAIVLGESFFYSAKYQTATFKSTEFFTTRARLLYGGR